MMRQTAVGPNVKVQTLVRVDLSPEQWQLYTRAFPRSTMNRVASYLNKRYNDGFNKGLNPSELRTYMIELMEDFGNYGAADTEPFDVLEDLIAKTFPKQHDYSK